MLHGFIKEKLGRDYIETNARTAFEAVSAIGNGYRKELKAPLDIGRWKVRVRDYETKEKLMGLIRHNVIHLYPDFRTAKSAWVTVAIGVVCVLAAGALGAALAAGLASAGVAAGTATAIGSALTTFVTNAGIAMIMQGAMNILFAPSNNTSVDAATNSKYLNGGANNTTAAGTRIPFGYGLFKIAGHYISYNVTSSILRTVELEQ
jgi:predicted phage tail protein